jgi:hypothetical protein
MDPSLHLHLPVNLDSHPLLASRLIHPSTHGCCYNLAAAPDDDDLSIWLFDYWLVDIHSFSCSCFFKRIIHVFLDSMCIADISNELYLSGLLQLNPHPRQSQQLTLFNYICL